MRVDFERDELGQSRWDGIGVADAPPDDELEQAADDADGADELDVEPALGPRADGRRRYDDDEEDEDFALDDDFEDDEDYDEDYDEDLEEEFDEEDDLDEDLDEEVDDDA